MNDGTMMGRERDEQREAEPIPCSPCPASPALRFHANDHRSARDEDGERDDAILLRRPGMGWHLARQPGPAAGARLPCKAIILRALRDKREQRAEERERGMEGGVEGGREEEREWGEREGEREYASMSMVTGRTVRHYNDVALGPGP